MRQIPMNAEMTRAVLEGRKTQTRRPVNAWRFDHVDLSGAVPELRVKYQFLRLKGGGEFGPVTSPYGQPGDRLWVREPARVDYVRDEGEDGMALAIRYMADNAVRLVEVPERLDMEWQSKYKVGWPVPKWVSGCQGIPNGVFREAARIILEVTSVRVERVQDISREDIRAEGISLPVSPRFSPLDYFSELHQEYRALWDSIYYPGIYKKPSPYKWDSNPWAWVVEFKMVEGVACK